MRRRSLSSHFRSWPWLCLSRLFLAAAASLLCWISLGCLGTCVAGQPRPANKVLSLVGQGRIRLGTPLRWHGHLCDEPARLPWGYTNELCADVLKIGHHGSKNSTMPEFLGAVQPRVGIASSGEANPYGHPRRGDSDARLHGSQKFWHGGILPAMVTDFQNVRSQLVRISPRQSRRFIAQ